MTSANQPAYWMSETADQQVIAVGDRLWWQDLNHMEPGRWVTVKQIDLEEGLVYCEDSAGTRLMTVPEELTTQQIAK